MRRLLFLPLLILAGCASRQAATMATKTGAEFAAYAKAANEKIAQAESARLELEVLDLQNKAQLTKADPAAVIAHTQSLIANRDARLSEWSKTNAQATNILTELNGIAGFESSGVTTQQILDIIEPLFKAAVTARTQPIPATGVTP